MNPNTFPTKGNLILAKNSLALAKQGFDLMDKKRNILMREIMNLISQASEIQTEIDSTFREAYGLLQRANIEMGIHEVEEISCKKAESSALWLLRLAVPRSLINLRFLTHRRNLRRWAISASWARTAMLPRESASAIRRKNVEKS